MCAEGWGKKEDNHARRSFAAPVFREEKNAETKENDSKAKSDRVMVMPDTIGRSAARTNRRTIRMTARETMFIFL